jgi:hypothetical protein
MVHSARICRVYTKNMNCALCTDKKVLGIAAKPKNDFTTCEETNPSLLTEQ